MSSEAGSITQSTEVKRAAVITHGKAETIGPALERLQRIARELDVELLIPAEEVEKHGIGGGGVAPAAQVRGAVEPFVEAPQQVHGQERQREPPVEPEPGWSPVELQIERGLPRAGAGIARGGCGSGAWREHRTHPAFRAAVLFLRVVGRA